jgi:hypothetical protein
MSLLTSVNSGSPNQNYFIENIGGNAAQPTNAVPCIKAGSSFGAIRVGNTANGLVIVGGSGDDLVTGIRGGYADTTGGASVAIGSSTAVQNNIVLTDVVTTINTDVNIAGVNSDLSVGGNINLTNGATGKSITGFYSVSTAVAGPGAQANPFGITAGTYLVAYVPTGGAQGQQPSGVFYWSGTAWVGNAIGANFSAGVPDIAILPTAGNATLTIGGGAASVPGALYWRKLLG